MAGPNFVLDKGFKVAAVSQPIREFEAAVLVDGVSIRRGVTAGERCLGVFQYDIPDAHRKLGGTKTAVGVSILGISRGIAGAAIPLMARVGVNAVGRFVTVEGGAAGSNANVVGMALTAASANGDHFDLLLTPGAVAAF